MPLSSTHHELNVVVQCRSLQSPPELLILHPPSFNPIPTLWSSESVHLHWAIPFVHTSSFLFLSTVSFKRCTETPRGTIFRLGRRSASRLVDVLLLPLQDGGVLGLQCDSFMLICCKLQPHAIHKEWNIGGRGMLSDLAIQNLGG